MIDMRPALAAFLAVATIHPQPAQAQVLLGSSTPNIERIGSLEALTLHRTRTGDGKRSQFLTVTLLPNRGMDVFQITADIPGRGETQLIASTSLEEAARRMDDPNGNPWGYVSSGMGGAFLIPWSSRISGEASPDHSTISTLWHNQRLTLHTNSNGKYAIHGLLHKTQMEDLRTTTTSDGQTVTGVVHAGDFGGRWISATDLRFTVSLVADAVEAKIEATNIGDKAEPMGIGWHPYFALPSHDRSQALLNVAAERYAETLPSDGLTTGALIPVAGTEFDFSKPDGAHLPDAPVNVNFSTLHRGGCVARLSDPAADYGLCVRIMSPAMRTVQIYSPKDAGFVAIEPQFNFPDPLGQEWKDMNTGLVTLEPGATAMWHVRLELFRPKISRK
ncbi:MAG TPA: aldose 1-epimerase [Terracidiphilus sp.]|nr:aldose 1-epimerase [Terracidiphilus sp.]